MQQMDKADAVILDIIVHEDKYTKCFVLTVRDHFKEEHVLGFSYDNSWQEPYKAKEEAFEKLCLAIYRYRFLCGEETMPGKYTNAISAAIDYYKKMLSKSSFDEKEAESVFVKLAKQKLQAV